MWPKPGKRSCRLLTPVLQVQKARFFAIFAFPLRSLRLKALVFERKKYEKLVTAKFAKGTAAKDAKKDSALRETWIH